MQPSGESWTPGPVALHVYVEDVDSAHCRAVGRARRASGVGRPALRRRESSVQDAWGNLWFLATHVADVHADELHGGWLRG